MSQRAKPFILNLGNAPRDAAATRPSPEPEAATEPSGQPGRVKIGDHEYEVMALTVTPRKVDHRAVRRYPAPPRRSVSPVMNRVTAIPVPGTLTAPIRLSPPAPIRLPPFAPVPVTRPAPIPVAPSRRLMSKAQPPLETE